MAAKLDAAQGESIMSQTPAVPIRILVLSDSPQASDVIAAMLQSEPGFTVSVAAAAYGEGTRAARQTAPDVVVLVADSLAAADPVAEVEELEASAPQAAVVVLGVDARTPPRDYYLAGARDCLSPPYDRETVTNSVRRAYQLERRLRERLEMAQGTTQRRHRCKTIAVHGVKGGVGATVIAANLAIGLRQLTGERVALVDASLQAGDIGVALNLIGSAGLEDLVMKLNELDIDLMNRIMVTHASGVRVLLAPRDLERVEAIGGDEIRRVLTFMSNHFDYIVVDTAPYLDAPGLAALDHSDQIVLLTTPEVPALRNAGRFVQTARRLGYPANKLVLVLNRVGSRNAVTLNEVEKSLGWRPQATIQSAGPAFIRAANHGEPIVKVGAWRGASRSLLDLARLVSVRSGKVEKRAGLGALFRRSSPPRGPARPPAEPNNGSATSAANVS
jgi:pilus assembly protein CpaE